MRKLIDIPEENKVLEKLQILAVKAKKDLKNYIQALLVEHVRGQK
jgi:endonuclease YncB( thermonuclease family)